MKKHILPLLLLIIFVFSGCSGDLVSASVRIKYKTENGEAAVKEVPNKTSLTEITIPDEYDGCPVTSIADFAAVNLENATVINIGKNVKEIGGWAFENDQKLTAFNVDDDNPYFCDVDGVLFTKDMKTLLFYPPDRNVNVSTDSDGKEVKNIEYDIPDSVETIRTKAFYKCQYLTDLTFPSELKTIEEKAFFRCGELVLTSLPDGLTLISKDAFGYCTSLKEISIPSSVNEIGDYAFYNCTGLLKINIDNHESDMTLGKKWYSTDNGRDIDDLVISWAE